MEGESQQQQTQFKTETTTGNRQWVVAPDREATLSDEIAIVIHSPTDIILHNRNNLGPPESVQPESESNALPQQGEQIAKDLINNTSERLRTDEEIKAFYDKLAKLGEQGLPGFDPQQSHILDALTKAYRRVADSWESYDADTSHNIINSNIKALNVIRQQYLESGAPPDKIDQVDKAIATWTDTLHARFGGQADITEDNPNPALPATSETGIAISEEVYDSEIHNSINRQLEAIAGNPNPDTKKVEELAELGRQVLEAPDRKSKLLLFFLFILMAAVVATAATAIVAEKAINSR